ncbi:M28 family peptidase [Aureispira anguillae]|uniref:M28 family peptidase n=1 Tax=Aureispira anguillae TaxID=2864201 RepID=A0A916DUP0_9BACT|nr:M28 family peptidase [Aureispira anguillae]BDS14289.1 M28 family peptidase [Aureispira anguillae]
MKILPNLHLGFILIILLLNASCEPPKPNPDPIDPITSEISVPDFSGDSAYQFVQKQVDFGPRIPETPAHKACSEWLKSKLESYGWTVQFQDAEINGFDRKPMNIRNIIASYKPEHDEKVLLCAHWDTRRMADQDTVRKDEPILGADDGGSGVGVLLELARVVSENPLNAGVEIVFFDAEDQGESGSPRPAEQTWCLGAQYWSRNQHPMVVRPRFGILLDMVGRTGAQFPKEGVSLDRAGQIVNIVWNQALNLGLNGLFVKEKDDDLIDDHVYVNDIAGIPTIDIINRPVLRNQDGLVIMNQQENRPERHFGDHWHTHRDNMDIIDRHTLGAVGEVLLHVLYKEVAE